MCRPGGCSAQCGVDLEHGSVELLYRALPGLQRKVGVPHGDLDGRVAHQLLDDLNWDTPPGEVATVGVPQVVPSDAPLLWADARLSQRTLERQLHEAIGEWLAVLLAEHVGAAQVPVCIEWIHR